MKSTNPVLEKVEVADDPLTEVASQISVQMLELEIETLNIRIVELAEVAPVGVFWSHPDGAHEFINSKLAAMLGVEGNVAVPNWHEAIHPDDRARVMSEWADSIEAGIVFTTSYRFLSRDGTVSWVSVAATPYNVRGKIRGYLGTIEDITARTLGEEERERLTGEREALIYQLQLTLDHMPIGCLLVDTDFRTTYWNAAADRIFGYTQAEMLGRRPYDVVTPKLRRDTIHDALAQMARSSESFDNAGKNVTKDGRTIYCSWHSSPLRDKGGEFIGAVIMCQDITSRVVAEEALRRSEETYRQIVDTAREGVCVIDADARTTFANARMAEILGYSVAEMIGKSVFDFMDEEGRKDGEHRMSQRRQGVSEQYDFRYLRKDGTDVWTIVSASPMYNADGSFAGALAMVTDISERKQQENMVWWQAYHDSLTLLPNRALFEDRLGQLLVMSKRQNSHVGVLFLDLDRFKHINDTLGHGAGDRLLKVVAERLTECLRAEDTIARMGGDEFTILLPGIDQPDDAAKVAQKLLDAMAAPVTIDDQELFVGGSIGISLFPEDGTDPQTLLKHADIAMYRAKEQGGNGYYLFTQAMNKSALEHLILENSLRKAIARNEFHLVYQPQIDLDTGEVMAVEALCRWRHPDLGVVQPAQFIPLAEETGIIVSIGEWVLNEACRQTALWVAEGDPLRVSVNISARQFTHPGLTEMVASTLERHALDPQWLDLELTESAIMKSPESAVELLHELRALGVRLSLDDFGTGYSSLSYLRQFPFDTLKIDRAFVKGLVEDPVDAAVVRAMVDLARALKLEIVSEGVETDEQCRALQDLGCSIMQGYLFSAPITAERVMALRPLMRAARRAA